MHRHRRADEVMVVDTGVGVHMTPGREREMVGPAHEFIPADEWHRLEVREGRVEGTFFYLGAAALEASGYELAPEPAAPGGTARV